MKFLACCLLLSFSAQANSGQAKTLSTSTTSPIEEKVPVKEGYQVLDMNKYKNPDSEPSLPKGNVKFTSGCTGKNGMNYKAGELGYEACLREAEMDRANGKKDGAAPNAGFSIGN